MCGAVILQALTYIKFGMSHSTKYVTNNINKQVDRNVSQKKKKNLKKILAKQLLIHT